MALMVTPDYSQNMVDAIRKAGGTEVKLTICPEASHDSWAKTYANEDVARWLLSQTRSA